MAFPCIPCTIRKKTAVAQDRRILHSLSIPDDGWNNATCLLFLNMDSDSQICLGRLPWAPRQGSACRAERTVKPSCLKNESVTRGTQIRGLGGDTDLETLVGIPSWQVSAADPDFWLFVCVCVCVATGMMV